MATLSDLRKKYSGRIAPLDMELLFSFVLGKPREFVLAHPQYRLSEKQQSKSEKLIQRRTAGEPIAYILGRKEFYGLDFKVTKNTLIPRPETELLVELALGELRNLLRNKLRNISVVDIGTGSGNIIISILKGLKSLKPKAKSLKSFGVDISPEALAVAKENARRHKLAKKIKFIQGKLLDPILKHEKYFIHSTEYIILANLPYLASKIYARTPKDVKDYEPKSALWSPHKGLGHYIGLLNQIKVLAPSYGPQITVFLEISPEQRPLLQKIVKKILPLAKISFHQDFSRRWRVCQIETASL